MGDKKLTSLEVCDAVLYHIMDLEKLHQCRTPCMKVNGRWEQPPADIYKINSDASFDVSTKTGGWGFLARGSNGEFLEGGVTAIFCGHLVRCRLKLLRRFRAWRELHNSG